MQALGSALEEERNGQTHDKTGNMEINRSGRKQKWEVCGGRLDYLLKRFAVLTQGHYMAMLSQLRTATVQKSLFAVLPHLPDILLQDGMDDDPHQPIEQCIDDVQRSMVIVHHGKGLVVNTSTLRHCGKERKW